MSIFPEVLKNLRQEKRLSQEQLSLVLSIPRTTISAWELGKRSPDVLGINILCDYFHVSSDYLLGRTKMRNPDIENVLANELSSLINKYPEIEGLLKRIIQRRELQQVCVQIKDFSYDLLLKIAKIAKILEGDTD